MRPARTLAIVAAGLTLGWFASAPPTVPHPPVLSAVAATTSTSAAPPPTTTTVVAPTTTHTHAPRAVVRASRAKATPAAAASGDLIDRLAMCESGMRQGAVGGGGRYLSYFQWLRSTWNNFRPGDPRDYSYAEQKAVVQQFFPMSSWRTQFPGCARKLGVA